MDDLITFLRAQLDDDERIARAAHPITSATALRWKVTPYERRIPGAGLRPARIWGVSTDPAETLIVDTLETKPGMAEHIVRQDPARVLADVAAKRRIVELHKLEVEKVALTPFDPLTGERRPDEFEVTCEVCGWASDDPTSGCATLRLLALPFADRPGWREEWRV